MRTARMVAWWIAILWSAQASAQRRAMVVHLSEAPVESMSRLAEAVTQLASYVQDAVPGLELEVKAFRKSDDALGFVRSQPEAVALVVCDAGFLLDLPEGFQASHRFVRGGRETRRKIVLVKSGTGIASLADLRGKSITVAVSPTEAGSRYLAQAIFGGELEPSSWFSSIERESDDFSATAAVLYGRTDAALVSEDNPLAAGHLGKELTGVYASGPVSLSVVGVRTIAFTAAQLAALDRGLDAFSARPESEEIRAVLQIDGFRKLEDGPRWAGNLLSAGSVRRELEIAIPSRLPPPVGLAPPGSETVPFLVGVELGEVTIPPELIDAVLTRKNP